MTKRTLKNLAVFVYTARSLKDVWPFYNIMHERVKNNPEKCHLLISRNEHVTVHVGQYEIKFIKVLH